MRKHNSPLLKEKCFNSSSFLFFHANWCQNRNISIPRQFGTEKSWYQDILMLKPRLRDIFSFCQDFHHCCSAWLTLIYFLIVSILVIFVFFLISPVRWGRAIFQQIKGWKLYTLMFWGLQALYCIALQYQQIKYQNN